MRNVAQLAVLVAAVAAGAYGCGGGGGSPSGTRGSAISGSTGGTSAGGSTGGTSAGLTGGGITAGGTATGGATAGGTTVGGTTAGARGVYFTEDFEGPAAPKLTTIAGARWSVGSPTFGPGSAHAGTKCAAVTLSASYVFGQNAVAATTPFSLAGATKPILVLFSAYDIAARDGGRVMIQSSTTVLKAIDPFFGYSRFVVPITSDVGFSGDSKRGHPQIQWLEERFDLTPFVGQPDVQIVFDFETSAASSGTFAGWFIDDITVSEETRAGPFSTPFVTPPVLQDNFDGANSLFQAGSTTNAEWQVQVTPLTATPLVGPGRAFSPPHCAGTCVTFVDPAAGGGRYRDNIGNANPSNPPERLVSIAAVQLGSATQAVLVFEQFFDVESTFDGARIVAARDRSTGPWIPLPPRDGYPAQISAFSSFPPTDAFTGRMLDWHRCSIDLAPAIQQFGQTFFIGFEIASDFSNPQPFAGYYIDDLEILTR